MLKKQIELEQSPFHKQRNMKAPRGSVNLQGQISQDMFNDFMLYARQYNAEHPTEKGLSNKANPLKHIINDFLNSHALERKCFKDLHVIIALDNPFDYRLRKSAVIGFVQHPEKFTKFSPFRVSHQRVYKTGLAYAVDNFNKDVYDLLNLNSFDREVLFNIHPSIYNDFDSVRDHLQQVHKDSGVAFDEDTFIVMVNLNNYFDILRDGVYTSETSPDKHEGVVVLLEPDYKLERLCVLITWSYNDGALDLEFHVENEGFFNETLSSCLPPAVYHEYWSISSGLMDSTLSKLEMDLQHSKQRVSDFKVAILMEERRQERIERKLDKLKQ